MKLWEVFLDERDYTHNKDFIITTSFEIKNSSLPYQETCTLDTAVLNQLCEPGKFFNFFVKWEEKCLLCRVLDKIKWKNAHEG